MKSNHANRRRVREMSSVELGYTLYHIARGTQVSKSYTSGFIEDVLLLASEIISEMEEVTGIYDVHDDWDAHGDDLSDQPFIPPKDRGLTGYEYTTAVKRLLRNHGEELVKQDSPDRVTPVSDLEMFKGRWFSNRGERGKRYPK